MIHTASCSSCAGTSGGSISADANTTVPTVQAVPAAAEQEALDASYNSGDSPYEISTVRHVSRIKFDSM